MQNFQPLLVCDNEETPLPLSKAEVMSNLMEEEETGFGFSVEENLQYLIFQLLKKPSALAAHVERIYFCYQHDLTEQLFAALVDFLIILEGRGHALAVRMVRGVKAKLPPEQYIILDKALTLSNAELKWLPGNMYSFFTLGLIGSPILIEKEQPEKQQELDPLEIVRDFIAYSQLDAAMDTLEEAVLQNVGRQELHDELLELYKLTQSIERFKKMYDVLADRMTTVPADWEELKGFFNG